MGCIPLKLSVSLPFFHATSLIIKYIANRIRPKKEPKFIADTKTPFKKYYKLSNELLGVGQLI
jgi:hypothetical protein